MTRDRVTALAVLGVLLAVPLAVALHDCGTGTAPVPPTAIPTSLPPTETATSTPIPGPTIEVLRTVIPTGTVHQKG